MAIKLGGGAATPQSLLLYPLDTDGADASGTGNDLTLSGANISSAVAKYGGGSLAVGGSLGNWKGTGTMPALDGDFTCEFWLYLGASSTSDRYIVDRGEGSAFYYDSPGWAIGTGGSTIFLQVKDSYNAGEAGYGASLNISSTTTQSAIVGSWVHVAVVRQGTTYRLYIDGTQEVSGSGSATSFAAAPFAIGAPLVNGSGMANGSYIDDFRLSGSAVYPDGTSFTPPTAAHPTGAGSTADISALYLGSTAVSSVYIGSSSVWSAGGGSFDLGSVSGLEWWFDASDTATITESSGNVSALADKVAGTYSLEGYPAASDYYPALTASAENGLSALDFDGVGDLLQLPSGQKIDLVPTLTLFFVASPSSPQGYILSDIYGASRADKVPAILSGYNISGSGGSGSFELYTLDAGKYQSFGAGLSGIQLLTLIYDSAGNTTLRRNGSEVSSGLSDTTFTSLAGFTALGGASQYGSNHATFRFCELAAYGTILSGTDLTNCEDHLISKWGIA